LFCDSLPPGTSTVATARAYVVIVGPARQLLLACISRRPPVRADDPAAAADHPRTEAAHEHRVGPVVSRRHRRWVTAVL